MPKIRPLNDPYDKPRRELREWICGRMAYHGMTQRELSRRTGIPTSTLSDKLKHPENMKLSELWTLQKVLGGGA